MIAHNYNHKIGFWSVMAIVIGGQIGSGVFVLPVALAPYGIFALTGWIISGIGAISLALVFSDLCSRFPKTGGPHAYVEQTFGRNAAFFTGWTYWVISWISYTSVVTAGVGYLTPLIGDHGPIVRLVLEILLLIILTLINLMGVRVAGYTEFFLTLLKVIPLVIIPIAALSLFNIDNMLTMPPVLSHSQDGASSPSFWEIMRLLGRVALMTLWGFVGLESATTPAGSVDRPEKTIPRAVVWGTLTVLVIYLLNNISLMGAIPLNELAGLEAPYVDVTQKMFGGQGVWHLAISLITAIICIGTVNAWVLSSGQVALGVAEDGLMPKLFAYKNKHGAPVWGLLIACVSVIPFLIFTSSESWAKQVNTIIDYSVTSFVFVYLICCVALLKILTQDGMMTAIKNTPQKLIITLFATLFCVMIIVSTPLPVLLFSCLFPLSGIPLFFLHGTHPSISPNTSA